MQASDIIRLNNLRGDRVSDKSESVRNWEYMVIQYVGSIWTSEGEWDRPELAGFSTERALNHFGAQGWELVSLGPVHGQTSSPCVAYILKRPIVV
jgi:Domain of unknown function (DUF4177)